MTRDELEVRGRRLLRAHEATWALWAVLRSAEDAEHTMACELGLPYTDTLALDHVLNSVEPIGPGEVSRRLGITTASATVLVDRLVASGHLARSADPSDGRRRILEPTNQARRDAIRVMAPLLRGLDAVAASLDPDTATAVTRYLRAVAAAYREYSAAPHRPR